MVYAPPTLAVLRGKVATDLRDPTNTTFTTAELNGLIGEAISEVSRIYPIEAVDSIPFATGVAEYAVDFEEVFRVEWFRNNAYQATIPTNHDDDSAQGGWDLFGGVLHLPWSRVPYMIPGDTLRVWGYQTRSQFSNGTPGETEVFDGDADAEYAVRTYAVLSGYQRLLNSRALFQQWTTDSVNSDMGPRWLMATAQAFESQWQRIRQQLRTLRRR
jgi:hypothetical protein